ncbi:MAG: hypothetical protein H5U07_03595 [Candidatus Aminicenantes bacterium]|nr:hypothetical protein [Candidatus Aminicenantes bacterium]
MNEEKYLSYLDKVSAPPGFEQAVLNRLRKERKHRLWLRRLELGLTAAVIVLVVLQLTFQPLSKWGSGPTELASNGHAASEERFIIEPVDLKKEIKMAYEEPQTIFILEQVSDNWIQQIKY